MKNNTNIKSSIRPRRFNKVCSNHNQIYSSKFIRRSTNKSSNDSGSTVVQVQLKFNECDTSKDYQLKQKLEE